MFIIQPCTSGSLKAKPDAIGGEQHLFIYSYIKQAVGVCIFLRLSEVCGSEELNHHPSPAAPHCL